MEEKKDNKNSNLKIHAFNNIVENSGVVAELFIFNTCSNLASCSSYSNSAYGDGAVIYSFYRCLNIASCSSYSNTTTGANNEIYSFQECSNVSSCSSYLNSTVGSGALITSFSVCNNITSCSSYSNTTTGGSSIRSYFGCIRIVASNTYSNIATLSTSTGFFGCNSVQQCRSTDSNPYQNSYADAAGTQACADTAAGGYNS
jgi:hypothetical protein